MQYFNFMIPLNLLSWSHILVVIVCIASIVFIPPVFKNKSKESQKKLMFFIISLILINQSMDLYREGYLDEWKLGLPLHLCDFSSFSILIYLLTKKRDFFIFAFFFGIAANTTHIQPAPYNKHQPPTTNNQPPTTNRQTTYNTETTP